MIPAAPKAPTPPYPAAKRPPRNASAAKVVLVTNLDHVATRAFSKATRPIFSAHRSVACSAASRSPRMRPSPNPIGILEGIPLHGEPGGMSPRYLPAAPGTPAGILDGTPLQGLYGMSPR